MKEKYSVRLFLLSNISHYFADHASEIEVLSLFEKCFFSAKMGLVKPCRKIFLRVLSECGISGEETVFIDDNPKNIEGVKSVGIKGYLLTVTPKHWKQSFALCLKRDNSIPIKIKARIVSERTILALILI